LPARSAISIQLIKNMMPHLLGALFLFLSACSPQSVRPVLTQITPSDVAPSPTSAPLTATLPPSPPIPTSLPPAEFSTNTLRAGISPANYIDDSCQYLAKRWDPEKSLPGTVVAPIMFHGIVPAGETPGDPAHINLDTFNAIVGLAKDLGFETITSKELLGFLSFNDAIPERAMILILDDRRPGTAEQYFLPVNQAQDWTTTLAWPIGDTDSRAGLWTQIEAVYNTGYFDVQSHGLQHNVYLPSLSLEEAELEIGASIPILEEHFGQTPIAYVWPGGIFTELGIQVARESGFELGFTVYSRGPIQFNWIPQGEEELEHGAPFLTLPRFWSSAALLNLEQTAALGGEAQLFARENYPAEATWYKDNCGAELVPLSEIFTDN